MTVYHGEDVAFDLYPADAPVAGPRVRRLTSLQRGTFARRDKTGGQGQIVIPGDSDDAEAIDPALLQYIKVERKGSTITLATSAASDDTIDTAAAHGLSVGDKIEFVTLTGGTGLSLTPTYYVVNVPSTTSLKVSATKGGTAIDFTTDITAGSIRKLTTLTGFFLTSGQYDALTENGQKQLVLVGGGTLTYLDRAYMAPHTYVDAAGELSDMSGGQDPFDDRWRLTAQGLNIGATADTLGAIFWRAVSECLSYQDGSYTHKHADGTVHTDTHDNDRTATALPDLTLTFDEDTDSNDVTWAEWGGEFSADVATESLYEIAIRLMQAGLEIVIDPDTFELSAYNPGTLGSDLTGAAWSTGVLRFQVPTDATIATGNVLSTARRAISAIIRRSLVWAGGQDVWGIATDANASIAWEGGYSSDANDEDALDIVAQAQLDARSDAGDVPRLRIWAGNDESAGQYTLGPGGHADLYDSGTLHSGSGKWDWDEQTVELAAIEWRLREDDNGEWDTYVEFGSNFMALDQSLRFTSAPRKAPSGPTLRLCDHAVAGTPDVELYRFSFTGPTKKDDTATYEFAGNTDSFGNPGGRLWFGVSGTTLGINGDGGGGKYLPVSEGTEYVISLDGYSINTSNVKTFSAKWYSHDYDPLGAGALRIDTLGTANSNTPTPLSQTLTAPAGATHLDITCSGGAGTAGMDNVVVTQTGSAGSNSLAGTATCAARGDHSHHAISTSDPTVDDDEDDGFRVSDKWTNTTSGKTWILTDASAGAAVWTLMSVTDHGDLTGLSDDDHTQYTKKATLTAKGSLYAASAASTPAEVAVGTDGQVLTADAASAAGVKWADAAGGASELDDLDDVDTSTTAPTDGDVLTYDSDDSTWKPVAPTGGGSLTVEEEDGTPSGSFDTIKFPNGALTDNGDGSVSVDVAGAGMSNPMTALGDLIIGSDSVPAAYSSVVLNTPGLVSYWRLGETAGVFADSQGSNDLTVSGSPTRGVTGSDAVDDDGAVQGGGSGYFSKSSPTGIPSGGAARTVEFWWKGTSSSKVSILSYGDNATRRSFSPSLNEGGSPRLGIWTWSDDKSISAPSLLSGTWHHIVYVYSGSTSLLIYLDGALLGTITFGGVLNTAASTLFIGRDWNSTANLLHGTLDELAIYNVALDADTVSAHYQSIDTSQAGGPERLGIGLEGDPLLSVDGVPAWGGGSGVVIPSLASDPASPRAGQVYFDTATGKLKLYTGSAWETITSS